MPVQWFVLDSAHGDYAGVLSALSTTTATKYTGSYTQVVRDVEFDTTLKIVKSNITDAERTGSLLALAKASEGDGVFIQEWRDHAHADTSIFDFLGESGRISYYIKNEWNQAEKGAEITPVAVGTAGGTVADAIAWDDLDKLSVLQTRGMTVWILGSQITVANAGWTIGQSFRIEYKNGVSNQQTTKYRFDYPDQHGTLFNGLLIGTASFWSDEGETPSPGTGHIWSASMPADPSSGGFYIDADVIKGEKGRDIERRPSELGMQQQEYTQWASSYDLGDIVQIHLPLGEDPNNRVTEPAANNRDFKLFLNDSNATQKNIDFYERKQRSGGVSNEKVSRMYFLRGLSGAPGLDAVGHSELNTLVSLGIDVWDGGVFPPDPPHTTYENHYKPWRFEGMRLRNATGGFSFVQDNENNFSTMDGIYIEDIDIENIGGHTINNRSGDGHSIGFQGGSRNLIMRGSLRSVRVAGGITLYAFTHNDSNPDIARDQDFRGLDIDCSPVDMHDHPEFSSSIGGGSTNDTGIHLTGDGDITGDFSNVSIKLKGKISGYHRLIRHKWGTQNIIDSPVNGGLLLEKGSHPLPDVTGIFCQSVATINQCTLSGSVGTWDADDVLEDPGNPGLANVIITRVVGANPTVTLQYRSTAGPGGFADTEACVNLTGTGTGTVNGAQVSAGALSGNAKYSNIRFRSDLDVFYHNVRNQAPDGLAAERNAPGYHVVADNNIYEGVTTGKFISDEGTQDFTNWQANSAGDNVYDDNSVNE